MKLLLLTAAVLAAATARPELYKENEDFQYSRSSTDEGSKAGYYGAQRGNMGGNYERAHNMDGLAQHQMSGLVKQVEGELGDGSKTRTGDVFTAANSRGIYGSGRYDLSNLQGRNFGEGGNYDSSLSHSSLSSASHSSGYSNHAASHSAGYSGSSQLENSKYQGVNSYGQGLQTSNLQSLDDTSRHNAYYGTKGISEHSSGLYAQSAYQKHDLYDNRNAQYASTRNVQLQPQNRLMWTVPVTVVGRPGSRVAVPLGVENYNAAQTVDQNAINSDAEILSTSDRHVESRPLTSNAKHYESAYSYRKQWEKHNTSPDIIEVVAPTENPFPVNSELHEDAALLQNNHHHAASTSQSAYSSNVKNAYHTKSASNQAQYQAGLNSQYSGSSGGSDLNAYSHGAYAATPLAIPVVDVDTKPKSYHSSYSYHKSWERQGDPYVIKPVESDNLGQTSQRLTSAASNQGYASHEYGAQQHQSNQRYSAVKGLCCIDEDGHVRVARSPNWQNAEDQEQVQETGQEVQDFGQQAQTGWNNGFENLEDLGQHAQTGWQNDLKNSGKDQDLGQQAYSGWNHYNNKENFAQQNQDLGQQAYTGWDHGFGQSENLALQSPVSGQQKYSSLNNGLDKSESIDQQTQNLDYTGFGKIDSLAQQNQNEGQQVQSWNHETGQSVNFPHQNKDFRQQAQDGWNHNSNKLEYFSQKNEDLGQQTQNAWNGDFEKLEEQNQQLAGQNSWNSYSTHQGHDTQTQRVGEGRGDLGQYTQTDLKLTDDADEVGKLKNPVWRPMRNEINQILDTYIYPNPYLDTYTERNPLKQHDMSPELNKPQIINRPEAVWPTSAYMDNNQGVTDTRLYKSHQLKPTSTQTLEDMEARAKGYLFLEATIPDYLSKPTQETQQENHNGLNTNDNNLQNNEEKVYKIPPKAWSAYKKLEEKRPDIKPERVQLLYNDLETSDSGPREKEHVSFRPSFYQFAYPPHQFALAPPQPTPPHQFAYILHEPLTTPPVSFAYTPHQYPFLPPQIAYPRNEYSQTEEVPFYSSTNQSSYQLQQYEALSDQNMQYRRVQPTIGILITKPTTKSESHIETDRKDIDFEKDLDIDGPLTRFKAPQRLNNVDYLFKNNLNETPRVNYIRKIVNETKNTGEISEQQDDGSKEIWEQYLIHFGKLRKNVQDKQSNLENITKKQFKDEKRFESTPTESNYSARVLTTESYNSTLKTQNIRLDTAEYAFAATFNKNIFENSFNTNYKVHDNLTQIVTYQPITKQTLSSEYFSVTEDFQTTVHTITQKSRKSKKIPKKRKRNKIKEKEESTSSRKEGDLPEQIFVTASMKVPVGGVAKNPRKRKLNKIKEKKESTSPRNEGDLPELIFVTTSTKAPSGVVSIHIAKVGDETVKPNTNPSYRLIGNTPVLITDYSPSFQGIWEDFKVMARNKLRLWF